MIEPEDFGCSDVQTFAHIGDPSPSGDHSVFWTHWFDRLVEHTPVLTRRTAPDDSDPSATHELISEGGARIGGVLVLPKGDRPASASLVAVHGYHVSEPLSESAKRWRPIADQGVAVLVIRLRGYPGSQVGVGDLTAPDAHACGWIGRGLADQTHEGWVVPHAVADVCNACRVMRNALLHRDTDLDIPVDESIDHPGVFLQGSSLGGGLAVIAAGQLIGKLRGESIVDRLAVSLPSLGDWRWRLEHGRGGMTGELRGLLTHHSTRQSELIDRLRLCDAVVHARRVRVPTLAMLAKRDDVVPAPSAAAVFNAIDADPGRKWRFVAPYGHFEGGISNARRHALFERAMTDFFDPRRPPIEAMTAWETAMHEGATNQRHDDPS